MQDAIAKVLPMKIRDHERTHICFDIAKSSFGFVFKTAEEGGDNVLFEIITRERPQDFFPVFCAQMLIAFSHYIKPYP